MKKTVGALWWLAKSVALGTGFLYLLITCSPFAVDTWGTLLAGPWESIPESADTLVVLGAGVLEDGTIGESSYWRAVYSARVSKQHRFRRIVYSGRTVSRAMREFALNLGVPAEVAAIEDVSMSTRENAAEVRKMPGVETGIVLLTSDYHMHRAARLFRLAGMEVRTYAVPDALKRSTTWRGRWPAFIDLATETVKIGYYRARGWI